MYDNSSDNITTGCTSQSMWFNYWKRWCQNQGNSRSMFLINLTKSHDRFFVDNRCIGPSGIRNVTHINWTCRNNLRKTWINRIMFSTNMPDYAWSKAMTFFSQSSTWTIFSSRHLKVKQFHIDRKWWYHLCMHPSSLLMDKLIKSKVNSQFLYLQTK